VTAQTGKNVKLSLCLSDSKHGSYACTSSFEIKKNSAYSMMNKE